MEKQRLTQRQNEAYEFIRRFVVEKRKPPTLTEIGDALDIASTNGVYKLLRTLEKKGWIERQKHVARGIRLPKEDRDPLGNEGEPPSLPVISRTPSDEPERLRERPRRRVSVDDRLLRKARHPSMCLIGEAGDDGMNGAGILKGDLLLIEEMDWEELENGVLVAALLEEHLLPREFYVANGRVHLRPNNRHYSEEIFRPDDPNCHVIGPVLGLMRAL